MSILLPKHTTRTPHAYGILTGDLPGGQEEHDVLTCCHCAFSWWVQPGSGTERGFCLKCNGPTCNRPGCVARGCLPQEKFIEEIERKGQILNRVR